MAGQEFTTGMKRSQSLNSILFYYSREKKCRNPEVLTESESENAEMTEETPSDGQVQQMCDSIVCDYSSDSSSYQSDPDQSEESLYPIHSVTTSCSTAEHESSMSFSDTSTKETHNCIEEPNSSTTSFQHAYEDDHGASFHINSSHNTTVFSNSCTPISGAKMSDDMAVSDIALSISQPPVQRYVKFPITMINGKRRSFNSNWYKKYPWIEYSVKKDAAFCYVCRFFPSTSSNRVEEAFTQVGFRDWKHAMGSQGMLVKHNNSCNHKQAMASWCEYVRNSKRGTSIENVMSGIQKRRIEDNRHYLKTVIETILLCARQNIGLRGHRENEKSSNKGNFLEILNVIARHDKVVKDRLQAGPRNAVYVSAQIQNTILNILGNKVRDMICTGAKAASVYSVLVDESKDNSKKEQLSVALRYVDDEAVVQEHFLTFTEATSCTAEGLTDHILATLNQFDLDPQHIVSQGYDGAAVMSGKCSGVQERLRQAAPYAVYIHCYAHTLNLVLVDSTKILPCAREFFVLLEHLYVFISTTKAHVIFMSKQAELHPDKQPRQLQKLSDTRWVCRYAAVSAICYTYDSILLTMEDVMDGQDRGKAVEAKGLYHQIKSFSFLTSLVTFDRILSCTKHLSDELQSSSINLASVADLVDATKSTLQDYRSNDMWEKVYAHVVQIAKLHKIECQAVTGRRDRRPPARFEDGIIFETTGSRQVLSSSEDCKINFYFPVLDAFLSELTRRFDNKNTALMRAIQACNPGSKDFLSPSALKPLINSYNICEKVVTMEATLAKRSLEKKKLDSTNDVSLSLLPLTEAYPNLVRLIRIALTIAVSTAQCERSFSTLRLIKNYLRSTMCEERLSDLAILSIEKEMCDKMNVDEVISEFGKVDRNRRIKLM